MKYLLDPLVKHYADFSGRANRKQFWLYALWLIVVYIAIGVVGAVLGEKAGNAFIALAGLALIVPNWAIMVRRLHDTDRSGWWVLISFLPLIGGLILFVFEVLPGTPGVNRFGNQPQN
ncbi:DUF805 domain-containing protein [Candidatus Avelusimicrobium faecicola]|uniref:DUF805 domain-containing protein n=1 Tax=Candidatus Avelusimicrobium faecicola TaxID=3416205 RepID=UPI0015A27BBF